MTRLDITVDNDANPIRLLIKAQGLVMRQLVREKLTELGLPYTERKGHFFTSEFEVPLPEGKDTGKIREYLAVRPSDPLLK
jgi:hypothetical protein